MFYLDIELFRAPATSAETKTSVDKRPTGDQINARPVFMISESEEALGVLPRRNLREPKKLPRFGARQVRILSLRNYPSSGTHERLVGRSHSPGQG